MTRRKRTCYCIDCQPLAPLDERPRRHADKPSIRRAMRDGGEKALSVWYVIGGKYVDGCSA